MIRPGETFVWGLDRRTAQVLLAAAAEVVGDEHVVRATDTGFIVPDAVWDRAEPQLADTYGVDREATF